MMELIMEVEDSFGIEVSDEIVETLQTPKDLINFLDKE
jgi:acyl carrier protein